MTVYYNENDPFCVEWLRNLIKEDLIPYGEVDDRSIEDVSPSELNGYDQHHFFAGIGGWSCALRLVGIPDDYPLWTGSCPCQSFSAAGKGNGIADERHLWPSWFHLITVKKPKLIFGEQVTGKKAAGWFRIVHSDLEALGYTVGLVPIEAASIGAAHYRDRYWFLAHPSDSGLPRHIEKKHPLQRGTEQALTKLNGHSIYEGVLKRPDTASTLTIDGVPNSVGIMRAFGNAIVPQVAAEFITAAFKVLAQK